MLPRPGERFADQAAVFDQRAGLPAEAASAVATAVAEALPPTAGDLVVEIGAGTGEIGLHLAGLPVRYLGIDRSRPMLDVFAARLAAGGGEVAGRPAQLVEADAERGWPVRSGSAAVVFASRVAHLLDPDQLLHELRRVCRPHGLLLVGRVKHDPESIKSRLRRKRETMLRERGLVPRGGAETTRSLLERLESGGATSLETRVVASWTTAASAHQVLTGWETVNAMGGVELPAATRSAVLDELRQWAVAELGDLHEISRSTDRYTLAGVRLEPVAGDGAPAGTGQQRPAHPMTNPEETWTTPC